MNSDSIANAVTDSVFIPTYIYKEDVAADSLVENIDFQNYVIRILNDSFPYLEYRPCLLQEKTYFFNRNMKLEATDAGNASPDWTFLLFFALFAFIAVLFRFFRYRSFEILRSCFSNKSFEIMAKSANTLLYPASFIFFPLISLLVYSGIKYFEIPIGIMGIKPADWQIFLGILICSMAFIGIKLLFVKFFGSLFRNKDISKYYILNQLTYCFLDALILLLPIALSLFTVQYQREYCIIASCGIFAMLSIVRAVRGLCLVFSFSKVSRIYLFCYLCIVEFLPLFIVAKVLIPK